MSHKELAGASGKLCCSKRIRLFEHHPSPLLSAGPRIMKPGAVRAVEGLKSSSERPRCWPPCPCTPATGLQGEINVPEDLAAYLEGSLGKLNFLF